MNRCQGLSTTNLVEEIVGTVKNYKELKSSPKYRNPAVSLGRILASKVVQKRSRFDAIEEASTGRAPELPKDAFQGLKTTWSLPFGWLMGDGPLHFALSLLGSLPAIVACGLWLWRWCAYNCYVWRSSVAIGGVHANIAGTCTGLSPTINTLCCRAV